MAMLALSNSDDAEQQRFGGAGASYFLGRVLAAEPNYDFARLKSVGANLNERAVEADLRQHCGPAFMQALGKMVAALPGAHTMSAATPAPSLPPAK
jgi:hypothetical protein